MWREPQKRVQGAVELPGGRIEVRTSVVVIVHVAAGIQAEGRLPHQYLLTGRRRTDTPNHQCHHIDTAGDPSCDGWGTGKARMSGVYTLGVGRSAQIVHP